MAAVQFLQHCGPFGQPPYDVAASCPIRTCRAASCSCNCTSCWLAVASRPSCCSLRPRPVPPAAGGVPPTRPPIASSCRSNSAMRLRLRCADRFGRRHLALQARWSRWPAPAASRICSRWRGPPLLVLAAQTDPAGRSARSTPARPRPAARRSGDGRSSAACTARRSRAIACSRSSARAVIAASWRRCRAISCSRSRPWAPLVLDGRFRGGDPLAIGGHLRASAWRIASLTSPIWASASSNWASSDFGRRRSPRRAGPSSDCGFRLPGRQAAGSAAANRPGPPGCEALAAGRCIPCSGGPCRPAAARSAAGFRLPRRCRTSRSRFCSTRSSRRRASIFLALKRLMPAASSKIIRRSRGDDCSSTSTLPCSMTL